MTSKKSNTFKYISAFDYFDKTLIFFIYSKWRNKYYFLYKYYWTFYSNNKCQSQSCISFNWRNNKEIIESNKNKNKKASKIFLLAKKKLNSHGTLVSQVLIDLEITHEEYKSIINEEENYRRLKKNQNDKK